MTALLLIAVGFVMIASPLLLPEREWRVVVGGWWGSGMSDECARRAFDRLTPEPGKPVILCRASDDGRMLVEVERKEHRINMLGPVK